MSPNVGNFVQDLVHMAQATERLPQVEEQLDVAIALNAKQAETIQARELSILDLKAEIETLNTKVRDAEVARDDAELRFLELDEKASKAIRFLAQIQGMAVQAELALEPPKPEPTPEPEPVTSGGEGVMGQPVHVGIDMGAPEAPQGQSESHPTAYTTESPSISATSIAENTAPVEQAGVDQTKPYTDKFYYDHPTYLSLTNWLAGGGSEENYFQSKPTPQKDYSGAF